MSFASMIIGNALGALRAVVALRLGDQVPVADAAPHQVVVAHRAFGKGCSPPLPPVVITTGASLRS